MRGDHQDPRPPKTGFTDDVQLNKSVSLLFRSLKEREIQSK